MALEPVVPYAKVNCFIPSRHYHCGMDFPGRIDTSMTGTGATWSASRVAVFA